MNTVRRIEHWGDLHHPRWLDYVRIILGLIILAKGIIFISSTAVQQDWIFSKSSIEFSGLMAVVLIHVVAFAHVIGGLMITMGLLTRLSVVIQMPIVLGAIVFVNATHGLSFLNSELWLSILVFMLLVVVWIVGSGPFSADAWIRESNDHQKHLHES
ncbi:DoxX family protein [Mucilaginibacter conchicola]|uniref:DoxX family protein n=1 Tax=Mucilaginibacter conchicola TaxID=2303333 RepID=A0A372NP35_9SPHI|nr:DoxX family protein [Mucilaginibacter conchicola]RFZ90709.1 DoxX family protein [Mucilaginibacter conchicola]